jgi:hypothetical protein
MEGEGDTLWHAGKREDLDVLLVPVGHPGAAKLSLRLARQAGRGNRWMQLFFTHHMQDP